MLEYFKILTLRCKFYLILISHNIFKSVGEKRNRAHHTYWRWQEFISMFIFSLFDFELAAFKLRARNKFCRLATNKDVRSLLKYKLLTIYLFLSQNISQYDRTALHIIKIKINFVATLRYRGLSFLWLVLIMVVEHGSIKHHPILS